MSFEYILASSTFVWHIVFYEQAFKIIGRIACIEKKHHIVALRFVGFKIAVCYFAITQTIPPLPRAVFFALQVVPYLYIQNKKVLLWHRRV